MTGGETPPDITVVVPVFENAATVEELAERLHGALDEVSPRHELLFVVDACPHGSMSVLRRMTAVDDRIGVLSLARNVGQHMAAMIGVAQGRGAWTVILDADLQDPPEAVPKLLAAAGPRIEAVFAGRRGAYESRGRLWTSRLFKTLLGRVAGVPRDAGIFVALRRSAVDRLLELPTDQPFVVSMIGCLGVGMLSLPVERSRRAVGRSAYSSWARLRSAWRSFACMRDCHRGERGAEPLWLAPGGLVAERSGAPAAPRGSSRR